MSAGQIYLASQADCRFCADMIGLSTSSPEAYLDQREYKLSLIALLLTVFFFEVACWSRGLLIHPLLAVA